MIASPSGSRPHGGSPAELTAFADQALHLTETMAAIHRRGWCEGTGGNFSCTLSHNPLRLLMAPSGVDKGSVRPEELIVVDGNAEVIHGYGRPSAETRLHVAIISRCHAGAVLHTHSQSGTLLSRHHGPGPGEPPSHLVIEQLEMLKGLEGIHSHNSRIEVPILEHMAAVRTQCLCSAVPQLTMGADHLEADAMPAQAMRHLEILEFLLEQQWRQLLLDALLQANR